MTIIDAHHHVWDLDVRDQDWLAGPEMALLRRSFSVEEAVSWLSNPMTGSAYEIELFDVPPPHNEWDAFDPGQRQVYLMEDP